MATAELHDDLRFQMRSLTLRNKFKELFTERTSQIAMERAIETGKLVIDADDMEACFDEAYQLAKEDLAEIHHGVHPD